MALIRGTRLGPYEITSALGAGGMGEVYQARDTRLERTVAVKILPGTLAADPERRQRFEREARVIASLSHPHICALHDVGTAASLRVRPAGRVPGHGISRRRDARAASVARGAAARPSHPLRQRNRRGPRSGAPAANRAPRPQTGERDAHGLGRQAARLRPGQGRRARGAVRRVLVHDDGGGGDVAGNHARHAAIHVAGADRGTRDRRAERHVRARGRALRDGGRAARVCRRQSGGRGRRDPQCRSTAVVALSIPRPRHPLLSSEGSRPALAVGAGCRAAAGRSDRSGPRAGVLSCPWPRARAAVGDRSPGGGGGGGRGRSGLARPRRGGWRRLRRPSAGQIHHPDDGPGRLLCAERRAALARHFA